MELEGVVGGAAIARKLNKNRGGDNAAKGQDYEALFVAHRTARLLRKLHETGNDAVIEWQADAWVDDVVIRREPMNSFKAYQLKNSPDVSWAANDGEITNDFTVQRTVCLHEGYVDTRLRLVCSDVERAEALRRTVPAGIADVSSAFHFPWDKRPGAALIDHSWLADDFGYLSRSNSPSLGDCEQVAQVLAGAWFFCKPQSTASEIYAKARTTSPTVLRVLGPREATAAPSDFVREILDSIPGFTYSIERGFLAWSAPRAKTAGILSFDCFSPQFETWQQDIVRLAPKTFDEIEGRLT